MLMFYLKFSSKALFNRVLWDSVDIRYVLFIVDKYAGARNLINEMTLVKTEMPAETTENVDMPIKENMESAN